MNRLSILALVVVPLVGCAGKARVNAKVDVDVGMKPAKKAEKPAAEEVVPASTNLGVANNLVEECMLQIRDLGKTPKFEYDDFDLLADDKAVLDRVGDCVVSGPLAGRTVQLIGRADSRGTTEYNLSLGEKRAHTVAAYLKRLGVKSEQIHVTTRGDLDAVGREESTWRGDRRVDLELMEDAKVSASR